MMNAPKRTVISIIAGDAEWSAMRGHYEKYKEAHAKISQGLNGAKNKACAVH